MEYKFSHIKGRSLHNPVLHLSLIGHFISEGSEKIQQVVCVLRVFYLRQDACMIKHDTDIRYLNMIFRYISKLNKGIIIDDS